MLGFVSRERLKKCPANPPGIRVWKLAHRRLFGDGPRIVNVIAVSAGTTASDFPVAAATPVPAAPPAAVPMRAPLPPPASPPISAPAAAPPPILVMLPFLWFFPRKVCEPVATACPFT